MERHGLRIIKRVGNSRTRDISDEKESGYNRDELMSYFPSVPSFQGELPWNTFEDQQQYIRSSKRSRGLSECQIRQAVAHKIAIEANCYPLVTICRFGTLLISF